MSVKTVPMLAWKIVLPIARVVDLVGLVARRDAADNAPVAGVDHVDVAGGGGGHQQPPAVRRERHVVGPAPSTLVRQAISRVRRSIETTSAKLGREK